MTGERQKLPPYGRHPAIASGGLVMIYCGSRAFKLAAPTDNRVPSVVYPKNTDPALYRWPVEGHDVLIFPKDEEPMKINILIIELLNQGAARVIIAGAPDECGRVPRTVYERPA